MQACTVRKLLVLFAAAVLAFGALAACTGSSGPSSESPSSASGSPSASSSSGGAQSGPAGDAGSSFPVSVVKFGEVMNADKLAADMEAGAIPVASTVCFDQMGTRPTVTVTDPETIIEIYGNLAEITVEGPSDESITDSYHHVGFELRDGTQVSFGFEGTGLLSLGRENYRVSGGGALWGLVRDIQDEYGGSPR